MMIVNNTRPDKKEKELIAIYRDVSNYWSLFGSDGFSGQISLKYMPLSKGYLETPYWLIYKLNFILSLVNKCVIEKQEKNR